MAARLTGMVLGFGVMGALVGALVLGLQAQEASDPSDPDHVGSAELELYIDVYAQMQADHGLLLDQVLAERQITLAQFRAIERRVQRQDRLVRKVRDALVAQARERAAQVAPLAANPVPVTPTVPSGAAP